MRAALLLSLLCLICVVAAAFGRQAVWIDGKPVVGFSGFVIGLLIAPVPPLLVVVWRKFKAH